MKLSSTWPHLIREERCLFSADSNSSEPFVHRFTEAFRCCTELKMDVVFTLLGLFSFITTLVSFNTGQQSDTELLQLVRPYFLFYLHHKLRPGAWNSFKMLLNMGDILGLAFISFIAHFFFINFVLYDLMSVTQNHFFDDPKNGVIYTITPLAARKLTLVRLDLELVRLPHHRQFP